MTIDEYITAVLNTLQLPVTQNRVNLLRAWAMQENTKAKNNPLATTWDAEPWRTDKQIGGYWFNWNNGFPVKNYSTPEIGIKAFANTVKQPGYYPFIYDGIKSGLPLDAWYTPLVKDEFAKYGGAGYGPAVSNIYANQTKNLPVGGKTSYAGLLWFLLLLLGGRVMQKGTRPPVR